MTDDKRNYVRQRKSESSYGKHACHWPDCDKFVAPAQWGCYRHWMMLPKYLRDKIWRTFRPGQEQTKTTSRHYLEAAKEVQAWIGHNQDYDL